MLKVKRSWFIGFCLFLMGLVSSVSFLNCSGNFQTSPGSSPVEGGNQSASAAPGTPSPSSPPAIPPAAPPVLPPVNFANFRQMVDSMPSNSWREIASQNRFSDVWPDAQFRMQNRLNAIVGPTAVITAWNGGSYGRGHLFFWGGGHADYAGNEIYSFDLSQFRFVRHSEPSIYRESRTEDCPRGVCIPADGGPNSTHSYGGVAYISDLDALWVGSGATYHAGFGHFRPEGSQSGWGDQQSFVYSFGNRRWTHLLDLPVGSFAGTSSYDPVSKLLLYNALDQGSWAGVTVIDVANNRIVIPRFSQGLGAGNKMLVVPERRIAIFTSGEVLDLSGLQLNGGPGTVLRLANQRFENVTAMQQRLGAFQSNDPGMAYDPQRNTVFFWDGTSTLRVLNLNTWQWSLVRPSTQGPNQTTATTGSQGIFGRWAYVAEHGVFVGYNDPRGNPWIYKP